MTRSASRTFAVVVAGVVLAVALAVLARPRPQALSSPTAGATSSPSAAPSAPEAPTAAVSAEVPGRVASSEPRGDRAPLDVTVRFTFEGAVDRAAAAATFTIDPPADGDLSWEGSTLVFRPRRLAPATAYKAEVRTSATGEPAHAAFRTMFPPPGAITPGEDGHAVLTFDDGPRTTSQAARLLDWLARNDVKALLFPSGRWAREHVDLLDKARADGHLVCNHGTNHLNLTLLPDARVEEEILGGAGHGACALLRPPLMGYSPRVEAIAGRLGYRSFLWDVDTRDWEGLPAEDLENLVLSRVFPGAVILFHMHGTHTEAALPRIVKQLRDAGYKLSYPLTPQGELDHARLGPGSSRPPEELSAPRQVDSRRQAR